jgi:Cu2+-exporting ATPase
MRSIVQASGAVRELAKLLPSTAQRIVGDRIEDVPISALKETDLVLAAWRKHPRGRHRPGW